MLPCHQTKRARTQRTLIRGTAKRVHKKHAKPRRLGAWFWGAFEIRGFETALQPKATKICSVVLFSNLFCALLNLNFDFRSSPVFGKQISAPIFRVWKSCRPNLSAAPAGQPGARTRPTKSYKDMQTSRKSPIQMCPRFLDGIGIAEAGRDGLN
jgi:hypothetical protein